MAEQPENNNDNKLRFSLIMTWIIIFVLEAGVIYFKVNGLPIPFLFIFSTFVSMFLRTLIIGFLIPRFIIDILTLPIIGVLISIVFFYLWAKRTHCLAYILNIVPVIPLDRLYLNDRLTHPDVLVRAIPLVGQLYDLYLINQDIIVPPNGWIANDTPCVFCCSDPSTWLFGTG
jgi:hypothetical protein